MKKIVFSLFLLIIFNTSLAAAKPAGVYWGFFDPPTTAHRAIMIQAIENLEIDELFVVVNQKGAKDIALSSFDRINLIKNMLPAHILDRVTILNQDYDNPIDYFTLKKEIKKPLHVIAGQASYDDWLKESLKSKSLNPNVPNISKYDKIYVIPSSTLALKTSKKYDNVEILPWKTKFYAIASSQLKDSKGLSDVKHILPENVWKFLETKTAKLNKK